MSELEFVVRQFPEHATMTRNLHLDSLEFRELCEDYWLAAKARDFWKQDECKAAYYREIVTELELEILEQIGAAF
jgi:hypothetical protein